MECFSYLPLSLISMVISGNFSLVGGAGRCGGCIRTGVSVSRKDAVHLKDEAAFVN